MADQTANGIAAPFPAPPPFYKHFTTQNIARLREARAQAGIPPSTDEYNPLPAQRDVDILSLPAELRYQIPPSPPPSGRYRSFGADLDLSSPAPTLADAGVEQLYPSHPSVKQNPQSHLIALTRSLLTTFLALVGILSSNPELYESKVEDLQTIMYNIHDLINRYRPHQARESLILMMEGRITRLRDEVRRIAEGRDRVVAVLGGLKEGEGMDEEKDDKNDFEEVRGAVSTEERRRTRQRAAWRALKEEFG